MLSSLTSPLNAPFPAFILQGAVLLGQGFRFTGYMKHWFLWQERAQDGDLKTGCVRGTSVCFSILIVLGDSFPFHGCLWLGNLLSDSVTTHHLWSCDKKGGFFFGNVRFGKQKCSTEFGLQERNAVCFGWVCTAGLQPAETDADSGPGG